MFTSIFIKTHQLIQTLGQAFHKIRQLIQTLGQTYGHEDNIRKSLSFLAFFNWPDFDFHNYCNCTGKSGYVYETRLPCYVKVWIENKYKVESLITHYVNVYSKQCRY
jgi:hypothetical protein